MRDTIQLEEVLTLALRLSPGERLRLVERVVSSVERDIEMPPVSEQQPEEHWGQSLNRLLDTLDMSEWQSPEFDDPVEWLKQQREQEYRRRVGDWGTSE